MNKVIKCINPKHYKLIEGNKYFVIDELDNYYIIKNENNAIVNYNKLLFKELSSIEELLFESELIEPEPVSLFTLDEIKNSLSISTYENTYTDSINDNYIIEIDSIKLKLNNNQILNINSILCIQPRHISCGIYDICNINDQYSYITDIINNISHLNANEKLQLINYIFAKCIMKLMLESNVNLFNASTNICYSLFEEMKEVIESFNNVNSIIVFNPNSNNKIILWTINMS